MQITVTVNGSEHTLDVEPRELLVHMIREDLRLTGTHIGCDTSGCGACTVLLDGEPVKSCTMFGVQADGSDVTTVEGLADGEQLSDLQQAFSDHHALQCGFCTPGFIVAAKALLDENLNPTEEETRYWLAGNLCRCTGYDKIIRAVLDAAEVMRAEAAR